MIRLFIQKDSKWQEVESDIDISLVINSEFLGASQSGSFSFPVVCPLTAKNRIVFQGLENPQLVANRRIEYPAQLLIGSESYENWYFVLREVSAKSYRFDLIKTPGNQPRNFYERKLHQLDFGKLQLLGNNSGVQLTNIWATSNASLIKSLFTGKEFSLGFGRYTPNIKIGFFFEVIINNNVIVEPSNANPSSDSEWWESSDNLSDRFNNLMTQKVDKNNYTIVCSVDSSGNYSVNVVVNNQALTIDSVVIKIYDFATVYDLFGNAVFLKSKSTLAHTILLYNCSYPVSNQLKIKDVVTNQTDYPFRFITYFNDSFYPSNDSFYEGIVNQYSSPTSLKLNNDVDRTSFPISPCFSLKFIITKIAEMMGYTLVSSLFEDDSLPEYLGEIYLINNVDLAQQLSGTTIPYNVYANEINYADFMPDMSVKEFIDALRTTFAVYVDYQFDTSKMVVEKMKGLLESTEVVDISDNVAPFPRADITDKKYFQLSFREADENIKLVRNYPADAITTASNLNYQKIEAGFSPVLNSKDLDEFLTTDPNPGIPTVEESARTPLYLDQQNNRPTQRLCFVNALALPDSNGRVATSADNKNDTMVLSWENHTDGQKGLLETCYQEYLDFLDNTVQWTTEVALTDSQIIKFSFGKKYMAYGTVFLAETLTTKLPIRKESQLKLLSL